MKNKILIVLLILFFPIFISAEEINNVTLTMENKGVINSEVKVIVDIDYSSKKNKNYGIGGYTYQLDFDDSIFIPTSILKNDFFNTSIYRDENNKYHVIGTIKKDNKSNNKCSDNILYCSNIKDTITFGIKNTETKKSSIKVYAINTYLYKINTNIDQNERKIIDSKKDNSKSISLENKNLKETSFKSIASKIKTKNIESLIESKIQEYKKGNDSKSNNYLSNLEIEGYEIDFDKHILSYEINVSNDINSININALSESENASVLITGDNDLKLNNNVVEIKVIAEDGSEKIYKINILNEEVKEETVEIETKEDIKELVKNVKKKVNNDKTIKTLEIIGVCLLGIILFIIIVKIITNNRLDKKLNDFDKF